MPRFVVAAAISGILATACSPEPTPDDLETRIDRIEQVDSVTKVVRYTKANDPEGALRTPGWYVDGAAIHHDGSRCPELGIDCGALVEEFGDAERVELRVEFLKAMQRSGVPGLGIERFVADGAFLLRVDASLPPDVKDSYEAAFLGS